MTEAKELMRGIVGYFTDPTQTEPAYQPPLDHCIVCWQPMTKEDCRSVCLMWAGDREISLFYRLHRICDAELSDKDRQMYEGSVLERGDEIAAALKATPA